MTAKRWATDTIGASSKARMQERVKVLDGYSTPRIAVEKLLAAERFKPEIWEPAAGLFKIVNVLRENGFKVHTSDAFRWHPKTKYQRRFERFNEIPWDADVITNPPFRHAEMFVRHAMKLLPMGGKLALLLRLQFLEGQKRYAMFKEYPPKRIHAFSFRLPRMHIFNYTGQQSSSVMAFGWFVWVKDYTGPTELRWINK